jgi:hypothetical protein
MNEPCYNEFETRQQIKTFAHTLDGVNYILNRLDFPSHKLRDVVDGLQGAAGGRGEFYLSHLALARRMRHAGKDETAEAYARRKVAALDAAQRKTRRMLFTVTQGGGIEHKRTHYVDHLTPAANWMMQQARASDLWEKHSGRAIEAFAEAAIEMLPPAPVEDEEGREPVPIEDDLYIQRMLNQSVNCAIKACDRAAEKGGDDLAIAEMAIERLRRYVRDRHNERAAASRAGAREGLQICYPPHLKALKTWTCRRLRSRTRARVSLFCLHAARTSRRSRPTVSKVRRLTKGQSASGFVNGRMRGSASLRARRPVGSRWILTPDTAAIVP